MGHPFEARLLLLFWTYVSFKALAAKKLGVGLLRGLLCVFVRERESDRIRRYG